MRCALNNSDELNIDLIDQVNPFQRAYEVISRDIDAPTNSEEKALYVLTPKVSFLTLTFGVST